MEDRKRLFQLIQTLKTDIPPKTILPVLSRNVPQQRSNPRLSQLDLPRSIGNPTRIPQGSSELSSLEDVSILSQTNYRSKKSIDGEQTNYRSKKDEEYRRPRKSIMDDTDRKKLDEDKRDGIYRKKSFDDKDDHYRSRKSIMDSDSDDIPATPRKTKRRLEKESPPKKSNLMLNAYGIPLSLAAKKPLSLNSDRIRVCVRYSVIDLGILYIDSGIL